MLHIVIFASMHTRLAGLIVSRSRMSFHLCEMYRYLSDIGAHLSASCIYSRCMVSDLRRWVAHLSRRSTPFYEVEHHASDMDAHASGMVNLFCRMHTHSRRRIDHLCSISIQVC